MICNTYIPFVTESPDSEGDYIALCVEFPGVYAFGETKELALADLTLMIEALTLVDEPEPIFK